MDSPFIFRFASAASGSSSRVVVEEQTNSNSQTNLQTTQEELTNETLNLQQQVSNLKIELNESVEELNVVKEQHQIEVDRWSYEVPDLKDDIANLKGTLQGVELELDRSLKREALMVSVKEGEVLRYKIRYELAEKEIVDLKEQVEDITHKLSAQNVQSGANSNVGTIDESGNEGCETVTFENVQTTECDYIRDLETFESDTDKGKRELSTLAKDVEVLGNSNGLLLKVAYEGYAGPELSGLQLDGSNEEYVTPEVSGLFVDGGNNGYLEPEVSGLLFDWSFAFKKVQSDHVTVSDLASVETDTGKNKGELSTHSKEVEILDNSMGASFTPLSCTTRSHTRGKRLKTALVPDQPGSQASNISKKLEMTESRSLKRKQDENSTLDATKFKVPRLNRSHTRGEKCVSRRRNEVEILKASVGRLTPILNSTTTRAHTRSLERQRRSNIAQTHSMDKQKTSLDIPKTSRVRRPVIEKKPEVMESRGRKRKPVDNIHSRCSKVVRF